ncbi:17607_t:CDS:2, partial [Entrophospora sp. SA101]
EEVVPYKLIYSRPLILKRVGDNKVIVEVGWDGINEREDEPVRTRFKCFSNAVTVKGSHVKHGVFGDHKAQFELNIHKKNVNVKCRYGTKEAKIKKIAEFYKTTENSIISSSSNVDENLQDKVDEYVEEEKNVKQEIEMKKSEFRTPETLTTVTIINDLDICNFSSISESEYSKNIEKIIE